MNLRLAGLLGVFWASTSLGQVYRRTVIPENPTVCLVWPGRTYTFHVHSVGSAQTPGDTEFDAIDAAFQTWRTLAASCSDFRFLKSTAVNAVTVGYKQGEANENIITFREESCEDLVPPGDVCLNKAGDCGNKYNCWDHVDDIIALTTTSYSKKTGTIFDADIEFNASPKSSGASNLFTTVDSPVCSGTQSANCNSTDIQNALTHEIGHATGLDHVSIPGATMEDYATTGELQKRIIDNGTAAGFCETYPRGSPTPPCDTASTIRRQIFGVNKGTNTGCAAAPGGLLLALVALLPGWRRRKS